MAEKIDNEEIDLDDCDSSDEAHLLLSGQVISETRGSLNLSRENYSLLCSGLYLGPYFFRILRAKAATFNGQRYLKELKSKYVQPLRRHKYVQPLRRHKELDTTSFQQDGAPPHIFKIVIDILKEKFGERLISRNLEFLASL